MTHKLAEGWKGVLTLPEGENVVSVSEWRQVLVIATNKRVYVDIGDNIVAPVLFRLPPDDYEEKENQS